MKDLGANNLIRFINITKKKEGLFANFKAKGVRAGMMFTSTIAVDLTAANVDPADSLEKIIEECAHIAVAEMKKCELQFEGLSSI